MSYRPLSFLSVFGIFWEGSSPLLGNPYFLCKNCAISRRCSPLPRRPDGFCVLDNLADARMLWHTLSSADIALRTFKQRAQPPTLEGAERMLCELVLPWIGSRDNQNGTMCFTLVELTDRAACSRTSFLLLKLFATKRFCHQVGLTESASKGQSLSFSPAKSGTNKIFKIRRSATSRMTLCTNNLH